jgi:hypothetical protein
MNTTQSRLGIRQRFVTGQRVLRVTLSSWVVVLIVIASAGGALLGRVPVPAANPAAAWPAGVAARVGGRPIRSQEFELAMAQFSYDLRPMPTLVDRRAILERLIDEELLYQDGLQRKLQESDPVLRLGIVRVMLALICAPTAPPEARDARSAVGTPSALPVSTAPTGACSDRESQQRLDEYLASLRSRAVIKIVPIGAP